MATHGWTNEQVLRRASEIQDAALRAAFLEQACGDDAQLRQNLIELLRSEPHSASLTHAELTKPDSSSVEPTEKPGDHIGPFRLLQQIGEGGMGVVYVASQKRPVRRRVALKIIKPGMDTRQVVARFKAERQASAMMDHPNIAKVLDCGASQSGRPYFVMELIRGIRVTKYCDDNQLTLRERLQLFVPICQAIQHAHQKGIIHRDIKPSNILVAKYDHVPIPKVIDFGVAKALSQQLTEQTVFTEYGQIVFLKNEPVQACPPSVQVA